MAASEAVKRMRGMEVGLMVVVMEGERGSGAQRAGLHLAIRIFC